MKSGNTKFVLGLAIGSAIGALVRHYSHTARAKQLKIDVLKALHEIEVDAEIAMKEAKVKAAKTGVKVAGVVAEKANNVKEKLSEVGM